MPYCPKCRETFSAGQYCPKDGTRLADDAKGASQEDPLIGQVIADRFRIVSKLGVGGMGTVYRAEHCYIKKQVALKLLRPEITENPDAVTRFQREALAASTIGHENIVAIDDFGRLPDGQVYLTMEFLDGYPLSKIIGQEALPLEQIFDVALQASHGLAAAHSMGIIHRDMKPENVFLTEEGRKVKILDFGIAKVTRADTDTNLTKTGAIFGTPHYMAPEQALGQRVDHRADIYSMGIILYEMLAGRVPFRSDSFMAVLTQHVTKEPKAPSTVAPTRGVPVELESVAMRAIRKKPEERFQDMGQLVSAVLEARTALLGDHPLMSHLSLSKILPPAALAPTESAIHPLDLAGGTGEVPATGPGERHQGKVTATAGELIGAMSPPRKRTGLLIGAMLLALLLGAGSVVAFVLTRGGDKASLVPVADNPAAKTDVSNNGSVKSAANPRPAEAKAKAPAADEKTATGKQVKVLVTSVPSGATIVMGERELGTTPESIMLPAGGEAQMVLKHRGYREREILVRAPMDRDKVVREVRLTPVVSRKRTRRRRGKRRRPRRRGGASSDHGDHGSAETSSHGHESSHDEAH
jgi:serine/threonine-protein kinase